MNGTYVFEYKDENEFRKKERAIKKYEMLAYKKLTFEYYPELRKGNFLGREVHRNVKDKTVSYELKLPAKDLFVKIHGEMMIHYTVYEEKRLILLTNITPEEILLEGSRYELATYHGCVISKSHPEKDMFRINLLKDLGRL